MIVNWGAHMGAHAVDTNIDGGLGIAGHCRWLHRDIASAEGHGGDRVEVKESCTVHAQDLTV